MSRSFAVLALGMLLVAPVSLLAVGNASAEYGMDLLVYGTVYDSGSNIVVGASVTITDDRTSNTYNDITDEFGQYEVVIPDSEWLHGDIIEVTATYGSDSGDTQGVAPEGFPYGIAMGDIHMTTAIPEFGSSLGSAFAAAFVGVLALVVIGRKSRPDL